MDLYCRLCAKAKSAVALRHNLSDMRSKLMECFGWIEPYTESDYPQNVCDPCLKRLDQSWKFSETIKSAQKELGALIDEHKNVKTSDSIEEHESVAVKIEPDLFAGDIDFPMSEIVAPTRTEFFDFNLDQGSDIQNTSDFEWPDTNADDQWPGDFDASDRSGGEHEESGDNNINNEASNNGELNRNEEVKKFNVLNKRQEFLDQISVEDRLDDGKINPEKIIVMKVCDWTVFKYKCYKCDHLFDTTELLRKHFNESHGNDTLQWICSVCTGYRDNSKTLWQLHTHVANHHYPHLFYW